MNLALILKTRTEAEIDSTVNPLLELVFQFQMVNVLTIINSTK